MPYAIRWYKIWKNEEDRWMGHKSKWKILSFFLSVPNGVEHEKKAERAYRIASGTKRALLSARIRCGREKGAWAEVPERRE